MKNVKRLLSLFLIGIMSLSLFACNGNKAVYSFKADDAKDSTSGQQKWLKSPGSNLVINPDALDGNVHNGIKQGMSVGIMDDNGSVVKSIDDAFFILEKKEANGKGDNIVWEANFNDTSSWSGLDKLVTNNSSGNVLDINIDIAKTTSIKGLDIDPVNLQESDYGVYFEVAQCDSPFAVKFRAFGPANEGEVCSVPGPGVYGASLRNLVTRGTDKTGNINYGEEREVYFDFAFTAGGNYKITKFCVVKLEPGYRFGEANESLTWYPYQIVSELTYPNNTAFKATDFFADPEVINKKIECLAGGDFSIGGKLNGSASYDSKDKAVLVEGDGFNYAVVTKRTGTVSYYKSEEEMLGKLNPSDKSDGCSYWVMDWDVSIDPIQKGSPNFDISIAASLTKPAKELAELAYGKNNTSDSNKTLEGLSEYWDGYIAENDIKPYILNIPESK